MEWIPHRLGEAFGNDGPIFFVLPYILILAAIPWPLKAIKFALAHVAFVAMAVGARRNGAAIDAGLASQSVILLACIRVAAWSPNILFWDVRYAAAVAGPAILLQFCVNPTGLAGLGACVANPVGSADPTQHPQPRHPSKQPERGNQVMRRNPHPYFKGGSFIPMMLNEAACCGIPPQNVVICRLASRADTIDVHDVLLSFGSCVWTATVPAPW